MRVHPNSISIFQRLGYILIEFCGGKGAEGQVLNYILMLAKKKY